MRKPETVGDHVSAFIAQFGFTNTDADRIWFHDFCHVLTGELDSEHIITDDSTTNRKDWGQQPTNRSEILAAVYQAVLLGENEIYPKLKELKDSGESVSSRKIINFVVPEAMKSLRRGDVDISDKVPQSEMYEHFQLAGHLSKLLEAKFDKKIGDVPRAEIEQMPMAEIMEMLETARGKVIKIGVYINR